MQYIILSHCSLTVTQYRCIFRKAQCTVDRHHLYYLEKRQIGLALGSHKSAISFHLLVSYCGVDAVLLPERLDVPALVQVRVDDVRVLFSSEVSKEDIFI